LHLLRNFSGARRDAVYACAIPLWQATAGCAAENPDLNQPAKAFAVNCSRSIKSRLHSRCIRKRSAMFLVPV